MSQQSSPQTKSQRSEASGLRPPKSAVAGFFWRWKMRVSGTFAFSMLERWEIIVLLSFFFAFIFLLLGGMYRYFPNQAVLLARRVHYYLVGTDGDTAAFSRTTEL